jgi:hypothetical protein
MWLLFITDCDIMLNARVRDLKSVHSVQWTHTVSYIVVYAHYNLFVNYCVCVRACVCVCACAQLHSDQVYILYIIWILYATAHSKNLRGILQEYSTHTNVIKYLTTYMNGSTLPTFSPHRHKSPTVHQPTKTWTINDFSFHFLKLYNLVINNFLQYLLYCKTLFMFNIHIHLM